MKYIFLFNPLAGEGKAAEYAKALNVPEGVESVYIDFTKMDDLDAFMKTVNKDDKIVVCGGDGTLNRFVNDCDISLVENDILYLPSGSGNDFMHDLGREEKDGAFAIKEYVKNLPKLILKDKTVSFINGIGCGIDGYCCAEGARLRSIGKKVNYAWIAFKAMFFDFKPANAVVTVDGETFRYRKVWMTPVMKGRFFGGGLMVAPDQNRFSEDRELSIVIAHDLNMFSIIVLYPSIFKGKHTRFKKHVTVHTGHNINVVFDRPNDLQIDGESISGISEFGAETGFDVTKAEEKREAVL